MRTRFVELIRREAEHAREGRPAGIHQCLERRGVFRLQGATHRLAAADAQAEHQNVRESEEVPPHLAQPGRPAQDHRKVSAGMRALDRHERESNPRAGHQ